MPACAHSGNHDVEGHDHSISRESAPVPLFCNRTTHHNLELTRLAPERLAVRHRPVTTLLLRAVILCAKDGMWNELLDCDGSCAHAYTHYYSVNEQLDATVHKS